MKHMQTTIASPISVSGRGLHTGQQVTVTFMPAPANFGICFQRIDLPGHPVVKASPHNVFDTSRGTSIRDGEAEVHTIEHLMAALSGLGVDNVLIKTVGPETPILDGSSRIYVEMFKEVGLKSLDEPKKVGVVKREATFSVPDKQIEITIRPFDRFKLTVNVDYGTKVLAEQQATLDRIENFVPDVYNCRTFVFLNELQYLIQNNLARGGDLDNAIVFVDKVPDSKVLNQLGDFFHKKDITVTPDHILNNTNLRHPNEPARHKLLDLIGDLYLLGVPLEAEVIASRPGHFANTTFARQMLDEGVIEIVSR
ncbi:MAG: UDP-3-O-acyl-N-acetylglucosamine deacetylase [Bacteroidales bacterium]|nr:UDP-3-O-acyl-N-acetylglucosamine deacetylase [Bacteroidales bacterium]MDY6348856.1 UDP-3-O-acyl-N-acetylglucosamine deacetylase [Bacteroidales bacterium]